MNKTHKRIKSLFIEGKSVTEIASLMQVTRQTVYRYKKLDLKAGIDWDELAYAKAIDPEGVKLNEKEFLTTLIKNFERELKSLDDIEDPKKRLHLLNEYAKSYYRLKAPMKNDCKSAVIEAATKTVYAISELALERDEQAVIKFLSGNADEIIQKALR